MRAMPNWNIEVCARCGKEARLVYNGPEWKRQYSVQCTENPQHTSRLYRTGREAVRNWNETQLRTYADCGLIEIMWIPKKDRMPTEADADPYGCVMIWDRLNGAKITGWRNTQELSREAVTHWARLPEGPK